MLWGRDALGVLLWVAELGCVWSWVVPRMPIHVVLQGFLCLLSLETLIRCCPQSPKLLVCEAFHICLGVVKLLWEGLS